MSEVMVEILSMKETIYHATLILSPEEWKDVVLNLIPKGMKNAVSISLGTSIEILQM